MKFYSTVILSLCLFYGYSQIGQFNQVEYQIYQKKKSEYYDSLKTNNIPLKGSGFKNFERLNMDQSAINSFDKSFSNIDGGFGIFSIYSSSESSIRVDR